MSLNYDDIVKDKRIYAESFYTQYKNISHIQTLPFYNNM